MIESITIKNFKSIGEVTVELSPVTVFVGRSGVGKSNFLRAIRFLRNYLLHGDQAVQAEGSWQQIWPCGSPQPLSISAQFRLPSFDATFRYEVGWGVNQRQVGLASEHLAIGGRSVFVRNGNQWITWPGEGPQPQHAQAQIYLNQFPTISEAVLAYAAWTNNVGWHDFPATVLAHGPQSQPLFGNSSADARGLSDNAGNYLRVLQDLTNDLRDQHPRRQILAQLRQINPTVRSVELDSVHQPKRVVVGHEVGTVKMTLDLTQESDGFRRYYAHLLSLYQTPPKQVLMFEEPENGIYPGALRNLAEEFASAPGAGRGQILLTTQSPELLDGFEAEQIRVVDLDPRTQQTRIGPLDPAQVEAVREQLLEPGELLTVDAARIASPGGQVGAGAK